MEYKDDIVSFEVAKMLKQTGFPQNLFNTGWYNEKGNHNGQILNDEQIFLAPTQALVKKWLREEHSLVFEESGIYSDEGSIVRYSVPETYTFSLFIENFPEQEESYLEAPSYKEGLDGIIMQALKQLKEEQNS